ncbi:MAG: glycoside hydrolase family 2 [Clostridia bacterium]|nr:glycoside hydrolase family 2 [Clostridia bacterium]
MSNFVKLYTKEGEQLKGQPLSEYPRPLLKRDSYICLNGQWDFAVTKNADTAPVFDRTILVPFSPECMLSGIDEVFSQDSVIWYRTQFSLPLEFVKQRVILHFGAVDQQTKVYLNDSLIGEHSGGYSHFEFDITDYLQSNNTLTVRVVDRLDEHVFPYGKQCRKRGGMWYTPTSGIWQTVWLESVEEKYIHSIKIDTGSDWAKISVLGIDEGEVTVKTPTGDVSVPLNGGVADIKLENPRMWCPDDPYLYRFQITCPTDKIESYFALRTLEIKQVNGIPRLCLNGKPYFFHGLLDQGYYSDGLLTPASLKNYEQDILYAKKLHFNMLRKHIKVEPEIFYYACDRLGMIVFQDMVNNGHYSFIRDTALPTVGLLHLNDRLLHRNKATRKQFYTEMEQTVQQLYNHPCICYWTIFNEGWGQFCSTEAYHRLRKLDSSRFIDSASGWFMGGDTDVYSRHIYFKKVKLSKNKKPMVLSEFGGYSYKPEGHVFNTDQTYGYGKYNDRKEFVKALRELYSEQVVPLVEKGLCAAVYTQVSDVEDETNGLISFDRRFEKVLPEEFVDISNKLYESI